MTVPKINSAHGSDTRNIINRAIEVLNRLGIDVQTLVAEGQLTEEQYAELITTINSLVKSGNVDKSDLTPEFKDEIEGISAQLAQKANQDKVWSMANMGQDVKTAMTGGSVAVVGPASTDTINLLPKSVTPTRTSFMSESTNIFNHMTALYGKNISLATGTLLDSEPTVTSEPILVYPGELITTNGLLRKAFYDSNGIFLTADGTDGTWTVPDDAYILRLAYPKAYAETSAQANRGDSLLPFESWKPATTNEEFDLRDNSVDTKHLKDRVVDTSNTNFIERSSNRFNIQTIQTGHSLNTAPGENYGKPTRDSNYDVSEFITVSPNKTYTHNAIRIFWYDEDRNAISSSTNKTVTIPSNATFVRLTILTGTADTIQLNESSELLPYEPYYIKIDNAEIKQDELNKNDFVELSSNRFNAKSVLKGMSLNTVSGENYGKPTRNSPYDVSEFITVLPNKTYTHNAVRIFWYDEDKKAIGTSTNKNLTMPSNAKFARMTINTGTADTTQLNESSELLPYEPYYIKIDNNELKQEELNKNDLSDKDFYVERLSRVFESPEMEDAFHIRTKSANDMYALWDGLLSSTDTKTKIATDSQGNDLFKYHFKIPSTMSDENVKLKKPKMVLIGGTHGNESAAVWTLYTSMKMIIEDWKTDEILESLRWGVEFVIVPIANPSGWDANTRKNGNGIDINRQFPTRWIQFDVDHITYGGEAPLTEPEAIAINNIIETEEDVIYFGDFHNFGTNTDNFMWNAGGTLFSYNIGESLVSSLSNHWKKTIPALANDGKDYYGYVSDTPVGSMALHAPKKGLQASTIEIGSVFFNEAEEFTGESIKRGVEVFINWLTLNRINNIKFYNNR